MTDAKTGWTPGPWTAGNRYGASYAVEGQGERGICSTGGYSVNGPGAEAAQRENLANAHLIAAAPELYKALDALVNEPTKAPDYLPSRLWNDARSALSKARGEQP